MLSRPQQVGSPTLASDRSLFRGFRTGGARAGRAFTTIELLVVIAIIALLITLTLGIVKVVDRMKGSSARVTLESLKSVMAIAETSVMRSQPEGVWVYEDTNSPKAAWHWTNPSVLNNHDSVSSRVADIWRQPDRRNSPNTATGAPIPVYSPGSVDPDNTTWYRSPAVLNTAIVLSRLNNVPDAAKLLESLPNGTARLAIPWKNIGSSKSYAAGTRVLNRLSTASTSSNGGPNDGMLVYVATVTIPGDKEPTVTSTDGWALDYSAVKDPFGFPILFVPSAGIQLGVPMSATPKTYRAADRVYDPSIYPRVYRRAKVETSQPITSNTDWEDAPVIRSPDGKPFWMSPGPDGNFDTDGDNIYSFEN